MTNFEDDIIEVESISLEMEDGTTQEFAILEYIEFEGKDYVIIADLVDDAIGFEQYIYGYTKDGDELNLEYIEDDDLYLRIADSLPDGDEDEE
ncbi:MAG: DUF1292 domain-containing protein [Hespellia sp.]|nr:DUF1292 domain-containing protein [Hespellia sp.]